MKLSFKTIAGALVLALSSSMLFAAESAYDTLYKKAQAYETQKKWISAAGTYYDAMAASPDENAVDAYNAFVKIINNIKKGNPGNDTYDDFTKVDGWTELIKDAEEYFTLNSPYDVSFMYSKGELNMEKKTCAYTFVPYANPSEKFLNIYQAIKSGKGQVTSCPVPEHWPLSSIYKDASKTGNAVVAAVTVPASNGSASLEFKTLNRSVSASSAYKEFFGKSYLVPAFAMAEYKIAKDTLEPSFYNMTFDIVDESGKTLASSGKAKLSLGKIYEGDGYGSEVYFAKGMSQEPSKIVLNVTSPAITAIDSGKFDIKITSFTLRDSSLAGRFVKVGEDTWVTRAQMRMLGFSNSEINLLFGNKDKILWSGNQETMFTEKVYKEVKLASPFVRGEEKNTSPTEAYFQRNVDVSENRPEVLETVAKSAKDALKLEGYIKLIADSEFAVFSDGTNAFFYAPKKINVNGFPIDTRDTYESTLNAASKYKGYKEVYSVDGNVNYKQWPLEQYSGWSTWKTKPAADLTADGFRFLTEEEKTLLSSKKIYNCNVGRSINPKDKEKIIAEYEAEQKRIAEEKAAAEKAKQERIQAALAAEFAPFNEQFLKEPADYKSDFKKVEGEFTVSIPIVGDIDISIKIKASPIEVTQGLYEKIMGSNPSQTKVGPLYPVNNVSYYEAIVFCNKLSMAAGLTPAYTFNKSTDPATWGAIPTKADAKWDKITVNEKVDGFRLPNDNEIAAYTKTRYSEYSEPYYVGMREGNTSKTFEGEKIYLPVVSSSTNEFKMWNTTDSVLEMFKAKKYVGVVQNGEHFKMASGADRNNKVGFRVVCGK